MFKNINIRYKLVSIHFFLSFLVSIPLFISVFYFWFPLPFFFASGGWQGLKLIYISTLILGPLLTLVVSNNNKNKKNLIIDIILIILLQFSVFIWGVFILYEQRPVAIVFWDGYFYTVPSKVLASQKIKLKQFGQNNPVYIYAKKPTETPKIKAMMELITKTNLPPHHQIELYLPLSGHYVELYKHEVNIHKIISKNSKMNSELKKILKKSKSNINENHYLVLISKYQNIILVFDTKNTLIGYIYAPYK